MQWLLELFRRVSPGIAQRSHRQAARSWRPTLEVLDDRIVPTMSSISSNFNGTPIAPGTSLWFNSVFKVTGFGSDEFTIHIDQATISSPQFNAAVPNANITFSPTATMAT